MCIRDRSELEDESPSHTDDMGSNSNENSALNNKSATAHAADWYEVPKVPLSAFRNKGINAYEEDEFMLPTNSNRKAPIGYLGNERTRKKIDKMKELQRKKTEKKRQLKKKKKLLKIRKEREKAKKEQETMTLQLGVSGHDTPINNNNCNSDINTGTDFTTNENTPLNDLHSHTPDDTSLSHNTSLTMGNNTRKNSTKSVGLDEIHEILGKDGDDLLSVDNINDYDTQGNHAIEDTDADILASLTAPVQFDNTLDHENSNSMWRRRPVSYTHLDVYKRQLQYCTISIVATRYPYNNYTSLCTNGYFSKGCPAGRFFFVGIAYFFFISSLKLIYSITREKETR